MIDWLLILHIVIAIAITQTIIFSVSFIVSYIRIRIEQRNTPTYEDFRSYQRDRDEDTTHPQ